MAVAAGPDPVGAAARKASRLLDLELGHSAKSLPETHFYPVASCNEKSLISVSVPLVVGTSSLRRGPEFALRKKRLHIQTEPEMESAHVALPWTFVVGPPEAPACRKATAR